MPTIARKSGFTLVELLIAVVVSTILITTTVTIYSVFRKSLQHDQNKVTISQNARIALDRLSRELRQTPDIVTDLPLNQSDTSIAQPGQIEFENGHASQVGDPDHLTYKKYYLSGTELLVDTKEYYFTYDPTVRVKWNAAGNGGATPVSNTISTQDIADNVQAISFYGSNVVQIIMTTTDSAGQTFKLQTSVYGRNL